MCVCVCVCVCECVCVCDTPLATGPRLIHLFKPILFMASDSSSSFWQRHPTFHNGHTKYNREGVLYIDLQPGQTCHSQVMHRKEVTHSDGSYEKKSRRRAWLKIWDKVKSHGTLIDWCTRRELPVNCITVISARWQSNMPFQRLGGRLNYYITRCDRKWELEIRWVRDKMW